MEDGILLALVLSLLQHVRHSYKPSVAVKTQTADGNWQMVKFQQRYEKRHGNFLNLLCAKELCLRGAHAHSLKRPVFVGKQHEQSVRPAIPFPTRPCQRRARNDDFSFKSATKLRPQMVYELVSSALSQSEGAAQRCSAAEVRGVLRNFVGISPIISILGHPTAKIAQLD